MNCKLIDFVRCDNGCVTLSFSPNADVLYRFHHLNAVISSRNTQRWLFLLFDDDEWKLSHVHPKKLMLWPYQQMELSSPSLESIFPFQSIVLTVPSSTGVKWWIHDSSMVMDRRLIARTILIDGHPIPYCGFSSLFLSWSLHLVGHCDVRLDSLYDLI